MTGPAGKGQILVEAGAMHVCLGRHTWDDWGAAMRGSSLGRLCRVGMPVLYSSRTLTLTPAHTPPCLSGLAPIDVSQAWVWILCSVLVAVQCFL